MVGVTKVGAADPIRSDVQAVPREDAPAPMMDRQALEQADLSLDCCQAGIEQYFSTFVSLSLSLVCFLLFLRCVRHRRLLRLRFFCQLDWRESTRPLSKQAFGKEA